MATCMERRAGLLVVASTFAYAWTLSSPGRVLADASAEAEPATGLIAELFALLTFVLLALVAHWNARRHRD